MTLTATATTIVKEQIIQNLCMQGCIQVLANPNRDNIRYAVVTVDIDNLYTSFSWLIDELNLNKTVNTPKVIVITRLVLSVLGFSYGPPTAKSLKYVLYPSAVVSNFLFGVGGVYGLHFCIPGTSLKIRGNFCKEYK